MHEARIRIAIVLFLALMTTAASPVKRGRGAPAPAPANLVQNGGFESGQSPWNLCGGPSLVRATAVHPEFAASGKFAARLGYPTTPADCPAPPQFQNPVRQAMYQQITIPANAAGLTVEFKYYVDGFSETDLDVRLVPDLYSYTIDDHAVALDYIRALESPGWVIYREVLDFRELTEVRGQTLLLAFIFPSQFLDYDDLDAPQTFRIDDVSVVPASIKTVASRRPASLGSDGSRPIAFLRTAGAKIELWRMDGNGKNPVRIYRGAHGRVFTVDWSPDGQRIAVGEFLAVEGRFTSLLSVINQDGTGHIPLHILPTDPLNPNFVYDYTRVAWSPDGKRIAASKWAHEYFGDISNTAVDIVNLKTRRSAQLFLKASQADWSVGNRLVYNGYTLNDFGNDLGLWEANMQLARPKATRVVRGSSQAYDTEPAWSPDGRRYVSIRPTSVVQRDLPVEKNRSGLMLYERARPAAGKMILFADHGVVSGPAWSADGKFILYNLATDYGTDIWWLEVATGKTGPLTKDGRSYNANWRVD